MRKVDLQAFTYVLVLSETQLYSQLLPTLHTNVWNFVLTFTNLFLIHLCHLKVQIEISQPSEPFFTNLIVCEFHGECLNFSVNVQTLERN